MTTNKKFSFDIQMFANHSFTADESKIVLGGGSALATTSSSNVYYIGVSSVDSSETTVTSPASITVASGGNSVGLVLGGGSLDISFAKNSTLGLAANSSTLNWNSLVGGVSVKFNGNAVSFGEKINNSSFSIASNVGGVMHFNATATNAMTQSLEGGIVFNSVNQNWSVAKGASVALGDGANYVTAGSEKITLTSAGKANYLDFALASTGALSFAGAIASLQADSVGFGNLSGGSLAKTAANAYTLYNGAANASDVSVNTAIFGLSGGASVAISGTGSTASVVAISNLVGGSTWKLGDATNVTLGGDENWIFSGKNASLTANTAGTKASVATLSGGTATLKNDNGINDAVTFNGGGWSFAGVSSVSFDSAGNIKGLTGGGSIVLTTETAASVGTGAGDALKIVQNAVVTLDGGHITAVGGNLSASSNWQAGASKVVLDPTEGNDFTIEFAGKAADSVYGVLTADSTGAAIASVTGLTGNATITNAGFSAANDAAYSLGVMGKNWTIAGDTDGAVLFDTLGNASVNGGTVYAYGDEGAVVTVAGFGSTASNMSINGAQVSISADSNGLNFALGSTGIESITGVDAGAVVSVSGDNDFYVTTEGKNSYHVSTSGTNASVTSFLVDDKNKRLVFNVEDGASYTVDQGNAIFTLPAASGDLISNDTVTGPSFTINGTVVSLQSANNTAASITSSDGDITAVTMKAGDVLTTTGDQAFAVVVDTSGYSPSSSDTVLITVNDTKISVAASVLANASSDTTTFTVNQVDGTDYVTITGGLATSADYSVTSGVYKVGQNSADTITDATGYITVASGGTATVENSSTKAINESLDSAISSLAGDTVGSAISAYQTFYNLKNAPSSLQSEIANWLSDSDSIPTAGKENYGYNIYADTTLGAAVKSVTLEAIGSTVASAAIVVANNEATSLANAVIDLSKSDTVHSVIIGAGTESVTANHTVIGASKGDTIIFGDKATGSNVAKAGDGDAYLVNKGKKSSLIGGAGNDTIVANAGDYVAGGAGADFFKDSAAYQINDYSVEDGDIIIASKLPADGVTKLNQLSLNGNVIQVNGGAQITLGSEYDENNSMSAIIAGADGATANAKYVAWASAYGSTVDASARETSAIIVGAHNEGAGDLLLGGSKADTISAGGNDSVLSGSGADYIVLDKDGADVSNGELGAMVALAAGKNTVENWIGGFDNENQSNILYHEGGADGISLKSSNDVITAYGSEGSMTFADTESNDYFNFLVGVPTDDDEDNGLDKVTFIKSGKAADVTADSLVADFYIGEKKNGINFTSGVEKELDINLGGDNYRNITAVTVASASTATIFSTAGSVKETVNVAGDTLSAENGAHKVVSLSGGNDLMISGGSSTLTAGNTFYFSAGDGKDTIQNFGFYNAADVDLEAADLIYINNSLGEWIANGGGLKGTSKGVEISTTSSDKVILSGAGKDDVIRVQFSGSDTVYNVKVGNSSSTSNFTYDTAAQLYYGNANKVRDTLTVAGEQDVGIWLTSSLANAGYRDSNNNTYIGVGAVNATNLTNSSATLVGADGENNTLTGAGSGSTTSLWGGMGGKNSLIGGAGDDTFIFFQGYGNNDTITSCSTSDKVWLPNVSVNDLDFTKLTASNNYGISNSSVELYMKDGSKLTVSAPATTTNFTLSDGEFVANTRTKAWTVA